MLPIVGLGDGGRGLGYWFRETIGDGVYSIHDRVWWHATTKSHNCSKGGDLGYPRGCAEIICIPLATWENKRIFSCVRIRRTKGDFALRSI